MTGSRYLQWSRDPAVGLFSVLPLWLCYEALRSTLAPHERNGVEAVVSEVLRLLPSPAVLALRLAFGVTVLAAAWSILRRDLPWLRITLVTALEGAIYALILGPLAGALTASSLRLLDVAPDGRSLTADLVGSLGAGIFEETLFRLVLLSGLAVLFTRAAASFGLSRWLGVAAAVLFSAIAFALFHHVGPQAPAPTAPVFVFRTMAGVLLGALFVARGIGVCVYAHALYDVHYYLMHR